MSSGTAGLSISLPLYHSSSSVKKLTDEGSQEAKALQHKVQGTEQPKLPSARVRHTTRFASCCRIQCLRFDQGMPFLSAWRWYLLMRLRSAQHRVVFDASLILFFPLFALLNHPSRGRDRVVSAKLVQRGGVHVLGHVLCENAGE